MISLTFTVPGRPIPLPRARVVTRRGRTFGYTPATAVAHKKKIQAYAIKSLNEESAANNLKRDFPLKGPVHLTATFYSNRSPIARPDASNLGKLVEDALIGLIYKDDCQIVKAVFEKEQPTVGDLGDEFTRITVEKAS